jgi:hypothetical protein
MKQAIGWLLLLIAMIAIFSLLSPVSAQQIDNEYVTVNLDGETASVTLKSVSITRAINELVDASVKGKQASHVVTNDNGDDVWFVDYIDKTYLVLFIDEPIAGSPFANTTDAKKALKKAMKDYYAANKTLVAYYAPR